MTNFNPQSAQRAACPAKAARAGGLIGRSGQQVAHLLRGAEWWLSPS